MDDAEILRRAVESGESFGGRSFSVLRDEVVRLRALIERLEWCRGYDRYANCPVCGWTRDRGHAPGCEMEAALKGGERGVTADRGGAGGRGRAMSEVSGNRKQVINKLCVARDAIGDAIALWVPLGPDAARYTRDSLGYVMIAIALLEIQEIAAQGTPPALSGETKEGEE